MKTFKFLLLITGLAAVFMLGAYTDSTINHGQQIEPYRWILMTLLAVINLFFFIKTTHHENI